MKKICVTSVVSLLIAFVLVFAGCEQPATAGLNNGGGDDGDNVSAVVDVGDDGDNVSAVVDVGDDGDNVSAVVDVGDDDVIVSVEVVEPDDPQVVIVDPALELRIVDLDGREGPFTVDYDDNPSITLKAVLKGGDGTTITDAVWKTDGTTAYSLQNNGNGTCTLTAQKRLVYADYNDTFTLSVSSGNDSGSCTIHYHADIADKSGFID